MPNQLILLNDVHCEWDDYGFLCGGSDVLADSYGERQSIEIAEQLYTRFSVNNVLASDASLLMKLIHHIQTKFKDTIDRSIVYTDALRERNFGVLSGTKLDLKSDVFTHSRICAEGGESIAQCRDRAVPVVKRFCDTHDGISLVISHSFTCQIIFNVLTSQPITQIDDLWLSKGTIALFDWDNYNLEYLINILE